MADDYPTEWGFQPDRPEPIEIAGRPIESLTSGCPAEAGRYAPEHPYPESWRR